MEKEEKELYKKYIDAEYNYMNFLRNYQIKKFEEETKHYIYDEHHEMYKYIKPYIQSDIQSDIKLDMNINFPNKNPDKKYKKIYTKLSLICHPDKCSDKLSNSIFLILNEAWNEKKYEILDELNDYLLINKTFLNYDHENTINQKKKKINQWKSELWYVWYNNKDCIYRDIFVSQETYIQRNLERYDNLKKENADLKEKLEKIENNNINNNI